MKLTKFCILPWSFMQIHAGGMMQCCAVGPDMDIGDFILDFCDKKTKNAPCDPFNNPGLQLLRESLLTGNLRPMCRDCFFVPNTLITTDEFRIRLINYLNEKRPGLNLDHADLRKVYAYHWAAISFTNRCNLDCIYCVQSTQKHTNPFFKLDYPYEFAELTLDYLASQGIKMFSTCVEGEATIYKHWYTLFSNFHKKYPHIKLLITTNLNREYTDEEIDLFSDYSLIDVSIDTLDTELYKKLRRNGRLDLVLKNLNRILKKITEKTGPEILNKNSLEPLKHATPLFNTHPDRCVVALHPVITNLTWKGLDVLAEYAFEHGCSLELGNYEERANALGFRENLIKPISKMLLHEQEEARKIIQDICTKAQEHGISCGVQGDLFTEVNKNVQCNYNYFKFYDDNPIFNAFYKKHPNGLENQYLDIVYDVDNISHEGIMLLRGAELELTGMETVESIVVREIHIYKQGTVSSRYNQNILLRYRKRMVIENGKLYYKPEYTNESIDKILLEICDCELNDNLENRRSI
jgi:sulfatase maturation enzyme AslB (radical SAM superfamily)